MKLSRALAVAANGMDMQPERLCSIAQALATKQANHARPPRPQARATNGTSEAVDLREAALGRDANLRATQASRSLLTRTIAMLK
jgi:flagellar basal body rod protein FlgC